MEKLRQLIDRTAATTALGLATLTLAGCGYLSESDKNSNDYYIPVEGVKYYHPGRVVGHEFFPGEPGEDEELCGLVGAAPIYCGGKRAVPPEFYLDIRQCGHKSRMGPDNPKGCGVFAEEVNKSTYMRFHNGDQITFTD